MGQLAFLRKHHGFDALSSGPEIHMKRLVPLGLILTLITTASLAAGACGAADGDSASAADTLTRRQKDSLISTMPIPGAGAVGKALDAQDALNERAADHDSIR